MEYGCAGGVSVVWNHGYGGQRNFRGRMIDRIWCEAFSKLAWKATSVSVAGSILSGVIVFLYFPILSVGGYCTWLLFLFPLYFHLPVVSGLKTIISLLDRVSILLSNI